MKILILLLIPALSLAQKPLKHIPDTVHVKHLYSYKADTSTVLFNQKYDTTFTNDTLEATIFLKQPGDYPYYTSGDERSFPIQGYAVMIYGFIYHKGTAIEFIKPKVLCYLTDKKRLINTGKVWDYKLREK